MIGKTVICGKDVFVAPNATVVGNVTLGDNASVWFGAVIRGDTDAITIGAGSNVQDNAVVHCDEGVPAHIGENVIVGHAAIVHGATIGDFSLVGMRATVMNHAKVGKCCIIGAHALVTERTEIPDYSVVMGAPAKVVKTIPPEMQAALAHGAEHYQAMAKRYMQGEFD